MIKLFSKIKAKSYHSQGFQKVMQGDFEGAIEQYTKAIQSEPGMLEAYLHRGNAYLDSGDDEHALADYNFVIDRSPQDAEAYYHRSLAHAGQKQYNLALADLNRAVEILPEEPTYYLNRSAIYAAQGAYDQAHQDTQRAIDLGLALDGYNNQAVYFERQGDIVSAIAAWTKTLEINPRYSKAYVHRGLLYAQRKEIEKALKDLKDGLRGADGLPGDLLGKAKEMLTNLEKE
jgi:tetratricopeptide (TPR) repeat protein